MCLSQDFVVKYSYQVSEVQLFFLIVSGTFFLSTWEILSNILPSVVWGMKMVIVLFVAIISGLLVFSVFFYFNVLNGGFFVKRNEIFPALGGPKQS